MPVYYPSARVRLKVRLDEFGPYQGLKSLEKKPEDNPANTGGSGKSIAQRRREHDEKRIALERKRRRLSPQAFRREARELDSELDAIDADASRDDLAEAIKGGKADPNVVEFDCLPIDASIRRNNILDADTATVTIDYRDLPLDPRAVRAAYLEITIGAVDENSHAAGMTGSSGDGGILSLVGRSGSTVGQQFVGFADEWSIEHGEDGSTVTLECKDLSTILRGVKLPPGQAIDLTKPIAVGIQELIDKAPGAKGLRVFYGPPGQELQPSESPVPGEKLPEKRQGKKRKRQARRSKKESLYDHVIIACNKLGLVPVFRGFSLWIVQPRGLTTLGTSQPLIRRMVWGRNLANLKFARKLTGVTVPTIEVRSPDPTIGRTRWARHPVAQGEPTSGIIGQPGSPQPTRSRESKVGPGGKPDEDVLVQSVQGVSDLATLEDIARGAYEQIARQEIEATFETYDLESFDRPFELDLLRLNPGDPVAILVAPENDQAPTGEDTGSVQPSTSVLQELTAQSVERRADYLRGIGYSPENAKRIATVQEKIGLANTFRVSYANFTWSSDDGLKIEATLQNYIAVREDEDEAELASFVAEAEQLEISGL